MTRNARSAARRALATSLCVLGAAFTVHTWAAEPAAKPAPKAAAAKPKPKAKGKEAPPADLLTREELRACMAHEAKLKGLREEALRRHGDLEKDKNVIQTESAALKQALETLDRTSEEAINAYKARAEANDKLVDAYNARLPEYNAAGEALRGEEATYAKNCAGRPFEEGDELAIKRAKK